MKCKIEVSAISTNFRARFSALVLLFPVHLSQKDNLVKLHLAVLAIITANQLQLKKEEYLIQTTLWENDWEFGSYGRKYSCYSQVECNQHT